MNGLGLLPLADVLKGPRPQRPQRDFGGWRLDRRRRCLYLPDGRGGERYWFPLDTCQSAAGALAWIGQVAEKSWASDRVLVGLVRLLDECLSLRGLR